MPAPQRAVVMARAFEELHQQVVTLTQLLSQRNLHPSPTPAPQGGFMVGARARAPCFIPYVVEPGPQVYPM